MAFTGFNFRSTLGYVTDTQPAGYGSVCAFVGAGAYSSGAGFGYLSSSPTATNRSTTVDARIAGDHTLTSMLFQMRVDMPAGNYKFRFAAGATGVTAAQDALIWDGGCVDGATTISTSNHTTYAASTAFALNRYTIFGTNLYKATTGGTTGAASPPTHTSGTATDGTVVWTFIKSAIARFVNASVTSGSQMDATGAIHTNANWPANNAQSAQVTVTAGFVTITRGQTANLSLRHFAFDPQSTPLQPLALFDEFGGALGSSFTVFAGQPPGYQVLRVTALAGAASYALSGDLATYFALQMVDEVQWVVQSTRIPDSVTSGTLTITQTDASPLISGSPFVNDYAVAVTSSGGRSTDTTRVEGLLSTQASLILASVINAHAGIWPGVTRASVPPGNVFQVSTSAEFVAAWNGITPDGSSNYCIELLDGGSFASNVNLNSKNFGTGGLLVTTAPGHDPEFNQISTNNNIVVRGLHFDNIKQPMAPAGGAFFAWRFGPYNGTFANRLKFTNIRAGYMYKSGATEPQISDLAAPGVGNSTAWVSVDHAEQLIIQDCVGDGTSQMIGCSGARILHIKNVRNMRGTDDFIALAIQKATVDALGIFADDNLYWLIEDLVYDRELDYAGFSTEAHRDFIQLRPTLDGSPYAAQRVFAKTPRNWQVGEFCFTTEGRAYVVASITTGVAGVTPPTGTSAGQVDGGVTWNYAGVYNRTRSANLVLRNCVMLSSRDQSAQVANGQFLLDSINDYGVTPHSLNVCAYNNIEASPATYGITLNHTGLMCAEYNVLAGADKMLSDYGINSGFVQFTGGGGRLLSRKNIVQTASTADSGLVSRQGDVISSFKAATTTPPNAVMVGPFTKVSGPMPWQYSLVQGPSVTADAVRSDMRAKLAALSGVDAGYRAPSSSVATGGLVRSGFGFGFGFRF